MKKTLKLLMLMGIIALGINFTEVKAETTTVDVTTAHQEAITTPETTTPEVAETTTQEITTEEPTTKPNVNTIGKAVKKGGYVKKKVFAYNLKLEKVTKVRKILRLNFAG